MPTYEWSCKECEASIDVYSSTFPPDNPGSCICGGERVRLISGGIFMLKGDDWPSKTHARYREDEYIRSASCRARDLKRDGRVKMEDHLSFKDVEKLNPE